MIIRAMFLTGVLSIGVTALIWPPHKMLNSTIFASEPRSTAPAPSADAMLTAPQRASTKEARQFVPAVSQAPDHRHAAQSRLLRLSREIGALNTELAAARRDVLVQQRLIAERNGQSARSDRSGGTGGKKVAVAAAPKATAKPKAAAKPKVAARPKAAVAPKAAARSSVKRLLAVVAPAVPSNSGRGYAEIHTGTIVPRRPAAARVKAAGFDARMQATGPTPSRSKLAGRQFLKSALADDSYWEQLVARSARAARTRKTWKDFLVRPKGRPDAKLAAVPHSTDSTDSTGSIGHAPLSGRHARLALAPQPQQQSPQMVAPPPSKPRRVLSRSELVLALQELLQDIGCTPGPLDGKWGRKGQDAMERAYNSAGIRLDSAVANVAALKALSALDGRICLRSCNAGEILQRDSCVRKPAPRTKAEARVAPAKVRRQRQPANSAAAAEPPAPQTDASWTRDIFGIDN